MPEAQLDSQSPQTSSSGCLLKGCVTVLVLLVMASSVAVWTYQLDSHHDSRDSIWWPERGRNLIPPDARDITLQRDLLDHWASYTIAEEDLNAFLDERFARGGEALDSFSDRSPTSREYFMRVFDDRDWTWTEGMVGYHYRTSNGATSSFYHDPTTGLTYQKSAYW